MGEAPILPAEQPESEVRCTDEKARQCVARRIAEHEQTLSALRGRSQEALVVRVTADDSVQHDDVGCLDGFGLDGDVVEASLCTVLERHFAQEPLRLLLVRRRELQVHGARGATLQQLDLDLTDAAADLEHGCTLDATQLEKLDHPPRCSIKPSFSIARRYTASKPRREEPVTTAWIAAPGHSPKA